MMKNFDWYQFLRKLVMKAEMQKIYDSWTVPSEIERWLLNRTTYYDLSGEKLEKNTPV